MVICKTNKVFRLCSFFTGTDTLFGTVSIRSFINGINHDLEAIKNAIKYPWSNGVVEGHVNRLKNKKREMYGRAGFELLRRKVVLSNSG
jgi:transposase